MLLPAVQAARETARQPRCARLLPYLEQHALHDEIDFSIAVENLVHDKPRRTMVLTYVCPSDRETGIATFLTERNLYQCEAATNSYAGSFGAGADQHGAGEWQRRPVSEQPHTDQRHQGRHEPDDGRRRARRFFTQAPWAGVMTGGTIRTTPGAPVFASVMELAPCMVLARVGNKPLNDFFCEPYDFFSPHATVAHFAFADGSAHPSAAGDLGRHPASAGDARRRRSGPGRLLLMALAAVACDALAPANRRLPWIFLLPLTLTAGCNSQPRAPALSDEPVYQNSAEGFRFLVPPGWSQRAKANLPEGKLGKERLLVQYRRLTEAFVASLEVTACDRETAADLPALLAGPSFGIPQWPPQGPPEDLVVDDMPVQRVPVLRASR